MTNLNLPEPSAVEFILQNLAVWAVPFVAYFLGIFIRKHVFPGQDSPPLLKQLLLGIPVCLVVVSPLISAIQESFSSHVPTYLFTVGIIMEHGMIAHETAAKHITDKLAEVTGRRPTA